MPTHVHRSLHASSVAISSWVNWEGAIGCALFQIRTRMTLAQIMPGPLAAQLAIDIGYVHYGVHGATVVGGAFVLPSFVMVVALGWAYQVYGGLPSGRC